MRSATAAARRARGRALRIRVKIERKAILVGAAPTRWNANELLRPSRSTLLQRIYLGT